MNMKSKAGFTLVELIVVIAILAILACVAVPAYSGYMTKAKEAADTQVVSALNTALAAACTQNGVAAADVTATCLPSSNKIAAITVTAINGVDADSTGTEAEVAADALATKIENDFKEFFGSNKDTVLGYYNAFDFANGNFSGKKTN